ncbi:MAG: LysM peptidoglycan-binding domain-containing protein [Pseudomonadota bacterium]|nr:LysM peptidoglycan-binding domain-containing protein [Pseudomonadota bacterium]
MRPIVPAALIALITVVLFASGAVAQVELKPSHPETYTVRRGDTLWDIAGRFLREPWRWPEIWESNREIANPDLIYPGDVLHVTYRDGRPRVGVRRGMRTVRLSPRVRVTPLVEPIPTIPIGAIRPFLSRSYVLNKAQIEKAPYVAAFPDEHIVAGMSDAAYVRSIDGSAGERFDIVRPGDPYRDPDTGDILGYKALFVADAVLERSGDPAKVAITNMALETGIGDRVISAAEDEPLENFFPRPAPRGLQGRIISVLNGVSQIGQFNVVVLNVGSGAGLKPGHVFEVYNGGERVRDTVKSASADWNWKNQKFWSQETWYGDYRVQGWLVDEPDPNTPFPPHVEVRKQSSDFVLPYERAGALMVFRAFDRVSFALVMRAERPIHVLDAVRPPKA